MKDGEDKTMWGVFLKGLMVRQARREDVATGRSGREAGEREREMGGKRKRGVCREGEKTAATLSHPHSHNG